MVDATRIEEHPNWRQKRDPPRLKAFTAKDRGGCDPDVRDDLVTLSDADEIRRLSLKFKSWHGKQALRELFDGILSE